jgi:hypothetical protein
MNQSQLLGILRIVVPVGVSLIGTTLPQGTTLTDVTTAVVTLASVIWAFFAHTTAAQVTAVTNMGATVVVPTSAPADLKAMAANPSLPKVTSASPLQPNPTGTGRS